MLCSYKIVKDAFLTLKRTWEKAIPDDSQMFWILKDILFSMITV